MTFDWLAHQVGVQSLQPIILIYSRVNLPGLIPGYACL